MSSEEEAKREALKTATDDVVNLGRTTFLGEQDPERWQRTKTLCSDVGFDAVQREILDRYGQLFSRYNSQLEKPRVIETADYKGGLGEGPKLSWLAAAMGIVETWRVEANSATNQ